MLYVVVYFYHLYYNDWIILKRADTCKKHDTVRSALKILLRGLFQQFCFTTKQLCELRENKNKFNKQTCLNFKRQTLTFHFPPYRPNSFKHLSHHTLVRPYDRTNCCDFCISHRNNTGPGRSSSTTLVSNTFYPQTYCLSRKFPELRLNGVISVYLLLNTNRKLYPRKWLDYDLCVLSTVR